MSRFKQEKIGEYSIWYCLKGKFEKQGTHN